MRMGQTRESGKTKPAYRRRKPSLTAVRLDCAAAFQSIARDCTARIAAHHSSACAGDAEAVHQIRVAITRLRAAVSFFAPMTVEAEWLRLKKEIAWLNGSLGAARDTDVAVDYAGRKRYRTWAQGTIGQDLDVRRLRDHRRLVRCLRSQRFRRLMEGLSDWIRKPAEPLRSYSKHKLGRWHKRLIRKGRRLKTMGASRRHRLRIQAKRLRYMLEVLTDIVPVSVHGEFRRLHRPAKCLQRVLGDLRDLERFSRLGAGSLPPEGGRQGNLRPPGYLRQEKKLLVAAVEAYHGLGQVEAH